MIEQERTAESFYTSQWLPSIPSFRDPFQKAASFRTNLFNELKSSPAAPCPLSKQQQQEEEHPSESSAASTASSSVSMTPDLAQSATPKSSPAMPTSTSTSSTSSPDLWKQYSPNATTPSSVFASLRPSPLNSHRNSLDGGNDADYIQVVPSSPSQTTMPRRKSSVMTLTGGKQVNRLRMQLRREHIMYDEVTKGQLPEITVMKQRLNDALSPFSLSSAEESPATEDEMSIRVLQSNPHYVIQGTILLESRKASWKKHSKLKEVDMEAQRCALPELSGVVDAWELPIDGSSLLELGTTKGGKKTFEFPQYRMNATCKKCEAGHMDCTRCGGLEAVDCFWCGSSGYFKGHECKKCNTTGRINCVKCNNTGKVECKSCDGMGAFKYAICVDLKLDSLSLPEITLEDLIDPDEEDLSKTDPEFLKFKATQAIYETASSIFEKSVKDGGGGGKKNNNNNNNNLGRERRVPVLANCHVERHMKRVLHVSRWNRNQPNNVEHTRFLFTTDGGGEKLTRLPFTMDGKESKRLEMLDQRENQRLRMMMGMHSEPSPFMRSVPHAQPFVRNASLPMDGGGKNTPILLTNQMAALSVQRGSL